MVSPVSTAVNFISTSRSEVFSYLPVFTFLTYLPFPIIVGNVTESLLAGMNKSDTVKPSISVSSFMSTYSLSSILRLRSVM